MRGSTARQVTMLALVDSDQLIPASHPIGDVKPIVDDPLKELEPALRKGGTTEMLEGLTGT